MSLYYTEKLKHSAIHIDPYLRKDLRSRIFMGSSCVNIILESSGDSVGNITIEACRNCCGALFVSDMTSFGISRGVGRQLLTAVGRVAEICGYSALSCIIPEQMGAAKHIFSKSGFVKQGTEIKNSRTGHDLAWFLKDMELTEDHMYCLERNSRNFETEIPSLHFEKVDRQ